jgi:hypothetical protein
MKYDSKLIAAIAAERGLGAHKRLPEPLRRAVAAAVIAGRAAGASVAEMSAAYMLSVPTVYKLLRPADTGTFGLIRLTSSAVGASESTSPTDCGITLQDSRSGVSIRVANIELAASLVLALR